MAAIVNCVSINTDGVLCRLYLDSFLQSSTRQDPVFPAPDPRPGLPGAWCLVRISRHRLLLSPPHPVPRSRPASQVVVDLSLGVSLMAPRWSTRLFISFPILFSRPELTITQWARRQRWLGTLLSSLRAIPPVHVFEPIALSGTALLGLASHFTCNCIQCIHKKLLIQELKNIIDYYKSKRRI